MYKQFKRAAAAAFVVTAMMAPCTMPFAVANAASAKYVQSDNVLQAGSVIPATLLTQVTSDKNRKIYKVYLSLMEHQLPKLSYPRYLPHTYHNGELEIFH